MESKLYLKRSLNLICFLLILSVTMCACGSKETSGVSGVPDQTSGLSKASPQNDIKRGRINFSSAEAEPEYVTTYKDEAKVKEISVSEYIDSITGIVSYNDNVQIVGTKNGSPYLVVLDMSGNFLNSRQLEYPENGNIPYCVGVDRRGGFSVVYDVYIDETISMPECVGWYDAEGSLTGMSDLESMNQMCFGTRTLEDGTKLRWHHRRIVKELPDGSASLVRPKGESDGLELITIIEKDGICLGYASDYGELGICGIDLENNELKPIQKFGIVEGVPRVQFTDLGGGFFINTNEMLYQYNPDTDELTERFRWADVSIDSYMILSIISINENEFICALDESLSLYFISTVRTEINRRLITIGAVESDSNSVLGRFAGFFNSVNEDYYVKTKIYSDETLLKMTFVTDECPDIIDLTGTDIPWTTDFFFDLLDNINADPDLSEEDFIEGLLNSLKSDDCITALPDTVNIATVTGRSADVGSEPGWTMNDLNALLTEKGGEYRSFPSWLTGEEALRWFAYVSLGSFVDFEKNTCAFENEEFENILSFCASLPQKENRSDTTNDYDPSVLLTVEYIQTALRLTAIKSNYGLADYCYIGFPGNNENNGSYYARSPYGLMLAIPVRSGNAQGAWDVIKTMFHDDWQNKADELPVIRHILEDQIDEYIEMESDVLNEEDKEKFLELLRTTSVFIRNNEMIQNIIMEEGSAFLAEDKTAAETAHLIQNRVMLYLGEKE